MCEVYLRLGDLEQAGSTLCTLSAEEITQLCTKHSALLLQAEDQFSHLAQVTIIIIIIVASYIASISVTQ